jgi:hypothetical protein
VTWDPPARPEWVAAVNRGHVAPITEEAARPLRRDDLLAEARARLGLGPEAGVGAIDGDEGFLEPLDIVLDALEHEAELTVVGRWMTRRFLVRLLEGRFQLAAYVRHDPAVRDEQVEAPIVVTGAPRSGTTVLYGLLALDPTLRAPEGWELLRPVPPPVPELGPDGRLPLADQELRMLGLVSSGLDAIHEYRGRMPKECLSAMSFALLSEEFTARYHVPSYAAHLARADLTPAYEVHRLVLQVLQRRSPRRRWLLKSPVHLHALPTLLAVYPDAHLVVTHRDPLAVLPSVTSLVATLRWAHSDAVDFADVGRYHDDLYHRALDGLVTADEQQVLPADRTAHSRYAEFVADPLPAVGRLYDQLGVALRPEVRSAMADHLAARPKGAHGEHRYAFADLGLDEDVERARFERYTTHFAVASEAVA